MASEFLNNLANKQLEKRKKKYGTTEYGTQKNTKASSSSNTSTNKSASVATSSNAKKSSNSSKSSNTSSAVSSNTNTSNNAVTTNNSKSSSFLNNLAERDQKKSATETQARNDAISMLRNKGMQDFMGASSTANKYFNKLDTTKLKQKGNTNKNTDWNKVNAGIKAGTNGSVSNPQNGYSEVLGLKQKWLTDKENTELNKKKNKAYAKEMEQNNEEAYNFGVEHPALATATSLVGQKLGGVLTPIGAVSQTLKGEEINPNKPYNAVLNDSDALREGAQQAIKNSVNAKDNTKKAELVDFLSSTGYSIAMSAADAALLGPVAGGIAQGLSAGASAVLDAKNRGASNGQAIASGVAQGVAEEFFEKYDLEGISDLMKKPFLDSVGKMTIKQFAKNMGKQMLNEGSSEAATDLANAVTDQIIMGDKSDFMQNVNYAKSQGLNDSAAFMFGMKQLGKQMGLSFAGGALSGAVFGSVGQGLSTYLATKERNATNNVETLSNTDDEVSNAVNNTVESINAQNEAASTPTSTSQDEVKASTDLAIEMLKGNNAISETSTESTEATSNSNEELLNEGFITPINEAEEFTDYSNREGEGFAPIEEVSEDEIAPVAEAETNTANEDTLAKLLSLAFESSNAKAVNDNNEVATATNSEHSNIEDIQLGDKYDIDSKEYSVDEIDYNQGTVNLVDRDTKPSTHKEYTVDELENAVQEGTIVSKNETETNKPMSMEELLLGDEPKVAETKSGNTESSNIAEIESRAGKRFGKRFHKAAKDAYINSYNGQNVVDYDEYMSDAYTAGKKGNPIASLSDNEGFNTFYRNNGDAIDAIWQTGYDEYIKANRAKNGGKNNGKQEVAEVSDNRTVQQSEQVRTGVDSGHGTVRSEENASVLGGEGAISVSEERIGDNDEQISESTGSRISGTRSDGVSEGNKVRDNRSRHGRGDGGVNTSKEETKPPKKAETAEEVVSQKDDIVSQPQPKGSNYIIPSKGANIPTTENARYKANVEAIATIKNILAENRIATTAEQEILAKYTGWGGISNEKWIKGEKELRALLTDKEYSDAAASLNTAYFTEPSIIRSIYAGLKSIGFNGGKLLEPSAGVGRFIGAMPEDMLPSVKSWTAVELDTITGNISKLLYPNADVRVQGFETAKIVNNYMDLVVGNVPFGNFGVFDKRYPKSVTSLIHNYFIARSIDTLREGGVACLITSSGTMNSKDNAARLEFAKKANLIGAIRLPNTAFNGTGTNVTTDILVFQKRAEGTNYSGEKFTNYERQPLEWTHYETNEYFVEHPEMVLGKPVEKRNQYGYGVTYEPLETRLSLEKQIEKAFSKISYKMEYPKIDYHEEARTAIREARNKKEGTAYKKDGKLYINDNGIETAVSVNANQETIYSYMVDIRDSARSLIEAMQLGTSDSDIAKYRTQLNERYDDFKKVYKKGFHDSRVKNVIMNDTDYAFVQALEKVVNKEVVKADIFTKNTINPVVNITSVETLSDGIEVSVGEVGYIDTNRIAELMHLSKDAVETKLENGDEAFRDANGNWVSSQTYLSGNVRAKLKEAEALAEGNSKYDKNVKALKKVVPEEIKGNDISVNVGVTWIPAEYYGQFAAELFKLNPKNVTVTYTPSGGYGVELDASWHVRDSAENNKIWGNKDMPFFYENERKPGLFYSLLNNKDLTVKITDANGKSTYDEVATEELRNLKNKINDEFNSWLWKDSDRRAKLEEVYNDSFNCMVRPSYSSNVTIAGQTSDIHLREHQGKAINRIVQSPYNTLLQHGAGAGKTFAMIGSVMKLRQLGIAKKPVIVVPKNKIGDWRNDFFKMFPNAKVLVADDTTFTKSNRKVFTNKIATTDIDAVIMSKEQFQYIPMTKEYQENFYNDQITACIAAIKESREELGKGSSTVRNIERRKAQLEKKLKDLGESKKDYDNISFEDTGIDYIFADEAQAYKNLMYNTNRSNVADMGAPNGNQITFDMLMKSNFMRSKQSGKGIVFGTATPVMNSPVEAYTMLKYLANEELEKRGIKNLDNFIDMFGNIESQTRQDAVGRKWTTRNAFSGFINMNEWQQLWGMVTDVVKTQDVPGLKLPKMKGGDRNIVVCQAGDTAREVIEGLSDRLKKNEKRGENHVFRLQSDGKKASFTQRFFNPSLPYGENEKVPVAVNSIFDIWKESKTFTDINGETQKNGVQLVFCDYGVPKDNAKTSSKATEETEVNPNEEISDERINVYQDMKDMLVAKGVPSEEIAFIHDAKNDSQRDALYEKVRNGDVRILIGSSKKMGEGLNVQDRIVALHEMNPLARPGDIEQVEARAIRQGNLSPEVAVNVYVTEDTFDTKQWDTLRNKSKFISEITSGTFSGRSADFSSDEFGASAADIMAVSSGNPLLKEQVETNEKLRKLENLQKAHDRKIYEATGDLSKAKKQIEYYKALEPKYKADAKKIRDLSGNNFVGRINGKTLTKRKDYGVELITASKKAINSNEDMVKVGFIGGLDLYVSGKQPMVELRGEASYTTNLNYDSPEGSVTRILNTLEGVKNKAVEAETIIKANEDKIPKLEEVINSKFDKANELKETKKAAQEIEAKLLEKPKKNSDNVKIDTVTGEILGDSDAGEVLARKNRKSRVTTKETSVEQKETGKQNQISSNDDSSLDWMAEKTSDNKVESPKKLSDIIADIQHDFGINITNGNIRGQNVAGEFNTRDEGIKTKITNDLPTIAHELGHWFDKEYSITDSGLPTEVATEFEKALGDLKSEYLPAERNKEGMAEFFRKYLQNRETAAIDYPQATKYLLSKLSPKDLVLVSNLADHVNAYYAMGAENAQSAIVNHENRMVDKRTRIEKFYDKKDHLYQMYVDSLHGLRKMGQSVGSNKAYIYASNAAYSDARAVQTLVGDIRDIDGNYVGPGLKTALNGITIDPKNKDYNDFGEYLVLKHGKEFLAQGKRVFANDSMNSTQYMDRRINELEAEHTDFRAASERVYQFIDDFMQTYAVDTGLLSQDDYNNMKAMYECYVPFYRAGYKNKGNSLARAKGSGREIINPIDNLITMVSKTTNAATRNNVLLQIRETALNLGVNATFIEKIPKPLRPKSFDMTGVKQSFREGVMDAYVDTQGDSDFADAMMNFIDSIDDTLVQFEIGRAKDNVIQISVDGQKEFWKVNDELLLESITTMNAHTSNALLKAYGNFTRFMTSNITGNNVIWSIFSNAPRDLQTAVVYSGKKNPLPVLKNIGKAYLNSFREASGKSVDPIYAEYVAMGGRGAGVWQGNENYVKDVRKMLNADYKEIGFNPLKAIKFVSETIEMGPRYAIYSMLRTEGKDPQKAFYEAMDLTVNFRRHGTISRDVNQIVPFFNASVQGVDKSVRWFTAEDMKGKSTRKNAALQRTALFVTVSAALAAIQYALNNGDDEDKKNYQLLSNYMKNSYYIIPLGEGKYFAVPKARELSALTSLIERGIEYTSGDNKHAFDDFYSYWAENCTPSIVSEVAQLPFRAADNGLQEALNDTVSGIIGSLGIVGIFAEIMANRDFLGRPIVSDTYKEKMKKDQYNANTSELAYLIGQATNLSPMQIDHFGNNFLGYMWENAAAVLPIDDGNGVKGEADYTLGVMNKYLKDNTYSQDITNWLYNEKSKDKELAEHDTSNMKAAIDYKLDGAYTSFYYTFNNLNKNNLTSAQREAKQNVLDTLKGYRDAKEAGIYPDSLVAVMSVAEKSGDSSILPVAMKDYVKDSKKTEFNLSDVQYVEYQELYNKYYYENIENQLNLKEDIDTQVSIVKQCKDAAFNKASNQILKKYFKNATVDNSEDDAGANIAKNEYKAALQAAREKDEDGQVSASEKYDLALEYYNKNKTSNVSAEEFYTDTLSKDQKEDFSNWKTNGGKFDNYDEYLDVYNIKADKDANGKTVSYSKKNKVASYITDQHWNSKLAELAWERAGYSSDTFDSYVHSNKYFYRSDNEADTSSGSNSSKSSSTTTSNTEKKKSNSWMNGMF